MSCASKTREIAHPIARLALILTKTPLVRSKIREPLP